MCHFHTTLYGCRHDASSSFIECKLYTEHQRLLTIGLPPTHPKLILFLEICKQEEDTSETHPLCRTCLTIFNDSTTTAVKGENSTIEENVAAGKEAIKALPEGAAARRVQEQSQAMSRARKGMVTTMALAMRREGAEVEAETEAEEEETVSDEERRAKRWEEVMRRRAEEFMLEMPGAVERRCGRAAGL
jgi:hypothetical protein